MNKRDAHFRGFARCVRKKIEDKIDDMSPDILEVRLSIPYPEEVRREIEMLIAESADMLALYILSHPVVTEREAPITAQFAQEVLQEIPDLTEWPEQEG